MRSLIVCLSMCMTVATGAEAAQQKTADSASPRSSSWRQIITPDLIVAGNASARELKRTLAELTRFRDTLARTLRGSAVSGSAPTSVVVLRDYEDFKPFRPRDSKGRSMEVGGYFSRDTDTNVIVLPAWGGESGLQVIFHEYTHYFVSRNVHSPVPTWLNEGLAEFYSTFRGDYRGRTLIGTPPRSHLRALRENTFVPLRDIVSPPDLESTWRWAKQNAMFYAESWALVHYITVERKNQTSRPLETYLTSLAQSGNHDVAFKEAFGTDVDGMDRELRQYVRRISFEAIAVDWQAAKQASDDAQAMSEADVDALEARLLLGVGAADDAERKLLRWVKLQPTHAGAQVTLARLRLGQDREEEAIEALQQVVVADPAHGPAHYYLGIALERVWRHGEAIASFSKALKLMPLNPAPWLGFNAAALGYGDERQAAAALQNALQIEWSPSYYYSQGLHALRLGRDAVAAELLAKYLDVRGSDEAQSVYPFFVRAIAARRAGHEADAEAALLKVEQANPDQEWTRSVLRYLQGRLGEAEFLRVANGVGEQTEARTYIGFRLALAGRDDEAVAHFRWVADNGTKNYLEYELARNELNRLKYRPKALPVQ